MSLGYPSGSFFPNCLLVCTRSTTTFVILSTALLSLYLCSPSLSFSCLLTLHVIIIVFYSLLYATVNLARATAACVQEGKWFFGTFMEYIHGKESFHIVPLNTCSSISLADYTEIGKINQIIKKYCI